MKIRDFDVTEIDRVFRSRVVELATKLEKFVSRLEQYKNLLIDLNNPYQADFFRTIKEDPDDPTILQEMSKPIINQLEKFKSKLMYPRSNVSEDIDENKHKKFTSDRVLSRYELELYWLRTVESNLFYKIIALIHSKSYFWTNSELYNIKRPEFRTDYDGTLAFFKSLEAIGGTDLDSAKKLISTKPRLVAYDPRTKKYCSIEMIGPRSLYGASGHIMTKLEFWKTFESWWDDESNVERMIDSYTMNCENEGFFVRDYDTEEEYKEDVMKWVKQELEQDKKEMFPYKKVHEWKDIVFAVLYGGWDDSVPLLAPKTLEPLIASMKTYGKKSSEELEENKKTLLSFPTLEQFYDLYLTKTLEWRPGDLFPEDLV